MSDTDQLTDKERTGRSESLNRAAEGVNNIMLDAHKLMSQAGAVALGRPGASTVGDVARAASALGRLADDALTHVLAAGGKVAKWEERDAKAANVLDLADLSVLSSEDAHELLDVLQEAQAVAERLDKRRGRTVGDTIKLQPGESRGTDYAEAVSELVVRLRSEMFGSFGSGRE